MLFVTFHGGSSDRSINNVHAYKTGHGLQVKPSNQEVLNVPDSDQLSELRAMVFAGGCLYAANGSKETNNILCFQGSGAAWNLVRILRGNVESVNHPFRLAFDGAGHCFVSHQDTNMMTIFNVAANARTATPGPVAAARIPTFDLLSPRFRVTVLTSRSCPPVLPS